MGEIKAGPLGVDQASLLLYVGAQHLAQRLVHQMGGRVVAHGSGAGHRVHMRGDGVANLDRARSQQPVVSEDIGLDFLGVSDFEHGGFGKNGTFVADLTAALSIKRGAR